jgi:hypothetical protein
MKSPSTYSHAGKARNQNMGMLALHHGKDNTIENGTRIER